SKQLGTPVTTVAHIIQKFKVQGTVANLLGSGRKGKIDDKFKIRIIRMVTKEPRTTSNEIRGELQGQGTSVSDRTILWQNWSFLASHISSMLTDAKMKHTKKRTVYLL